jgi:hypothetical protein
MEYRHDLFISYSSADRSWAEKLNTDLLARDDKLRIFFDRQSLREGAKWEDQLNAALKSSRHLAVLWSDKAADPNSWVGPEIQTFDAAASASGNPNERLVFYIPLQGKRQNLESLQALPDIRELEVYGKEENELEPDIKQKKADAWARIITKILNGMRMDPNMDSVPLAILTASRFEFDRIPRDDEDVAMNLDSLVARVGTLTYEELQSRYMEKPLDWRPFGGARTIVDLFDEILVPINTTLANANQRAIRWELIDFANIKVGDDAAVSRIVSQLNSQFSILVVDPIALYHRRIRRIFRFFGPVLANDRTVTVTFSPVTNEAPFHVSYSVRDLVRPILDAYFDPPVTVVNRFPNFGMNITQCDDIRRLVMLGLLQSRVVVAPDGGNAFTRARRA